MTAGRMCAASIVVWFCLAVSVAGAAAPTSQPATKAKEFTVRTTDGLDLTFAADGTVRAVAVGGRALPMTGPGGFYLTEIVAPKGKRTEHGLLQGKVTQVGGRLRFESRDCDGLKVLATFEATDRIDVAGEVVDTTGKDRAAKVEFVLPVDLVGWTYDNTPYQRVTLKKSTVYPGPDDPGTRTIDDLEPPEMKKTVTVDIGRLPFNAVHDDKSGLSVGVPMSQPRMFLLSADPRGLVTRFNLGVSPATRKFPSRASFHFSLFRTDPAWGIRSAAERWYAFHPELYASKADAYGNLVGIERIMTDLPDKRDFHVTWAEKDFQWTDGEYFPALKDTVEQLGVTWFHWREPWSWFCPVPEETSPDEQVAQMKKWAKNDSRAETHSQDAGAALGYSAQTCLNSYCEDADGKLIQVRRISGTWMTAVNLDPELPHPNRADLALDWQFRWVKQFDDPGFDGPRNVAWDSCTGWTGQEKFNYRREHFPYVDNPLTFDPAGRLCQLKALHDWEFAKLHSDLVRSHNGLVCGNISPLAVLLYGQHIDVFVREATARDIRGDYGIVMRMLVNRRPMAFYRPPEDVDTVRLATFYGFAPGLDATDEKWRPVAKRFMPLIEKMNDAGWEPVTHARGEGLRVERFGRTPGYLYFTVRGEQGQAVEGGRVRIDAKALGINPQAVTVRDLAEDRKVEQQAADGAITVKADLKPQETLVLLVEAKH